MAASTTTQNVGEDQPVVQLKPKDFKGPVDPDWCAGCGDFGVLSCVQKACAELGLRPHEILTVRAPAILLTTRWGRRESSM